MADYTYLGPERSNGVRRNSDNVSIPADPANRDWQEFERWEQGLTDSYISSRIEYENYQAIINYENDLLAWENCIAACADLPAGSACEAACGDQPKAPTGYNSQEAVDDSKAAHAEWQACMDACAANPPEEVSCERLCGAEPEILLRPDELVPVPAPGDPVAQVADAYEAPAPPIQEQRITVIFDTAQAAEIQDQLQLIADDSSGGQNELRQHVRYIASVLSLGFSAALGETD